MIRAGHVDEVSNHNAAQVAQTQLAGDGLSRLQIGLEDGVFKITHPDITTRIHIHRGQRFGLVNDQVATGFEVHPTAQCLGDFLVNRVKVENRPLTFVELQALRRFGHELKTKRLQFGKLLL